MTNYDYDDSAQLAAEMIADRWAERESEMGPEDDWPSSSWFADQS
ncbi:hypothetical protein [Streptomyces sp. BRB081]|nr:hypothetical protein [Streptomyces sp. BRB081]